MTEIRKCQVLIIGAGPGGYVAGIRAGQLGLDTIVVEGDKSGGTCLIRGCIPSKAMIHAAERFESLSKHSSENGHMGITISSEPVLDMPSLISWKDSIVERLNKGVESLLKGAGVDLVKGWATFTGPKRCTVKTSEGDIEIEAENVIIATGSSHIDLPFMPCDEEFILSSTGALELDSLPSKVAIVGGGYIGLEMGSVWSRLGTEVHVIEFLDHITPGMDKEISKEFMKILKKQGINFHMQHKVEQIKRSNSGAIVSTKDKEGNKKDFNSDIVLVSVGRKPNTSGLNLEKVDIELDEKKRIKTDKYFKTNQDNIYAIGDVIAGPMLAHKAEDEGIAVAENIAGQSGHVNYDTIPGVVYTSPEVASIGKTEEQLKELNIKYKIGKFSFMANSRAKAIDDAEGFVKILADEKTDKVLGAHLIGPHAGELIAEIGVAMEFGASSEDIARTCHAHPTFSEAVKEAALAAGTGAIHI